MTFSYTYLQDEHLVVANANGVDQVADGVYTTDRVIRDIANVCFVQLKLWG